MSRDGHHWPTGRSKVRSPGRLASARPRSREDGYSDEPHFILADMRGLKPCPPDAAAELGELIKYGRMHGVSGCAHLSDSSIAKLQTARLARQATPNDDITIDVISMEEAHNVLSERRAELVLNGKLKSA